MTFPRKDISGKRETPRPCRGSLLFLFVFLLAANPRAGTFRDSLFSRGWDTVHCRVSDSISLAVRYPDSLRMEYGPTRPNRTATTPRTPDVMVVNNNRFRYFWTDSVTAGGFGPRLCSRDLTIIDTGIALGDTVSVSGAQTMVPRPAYLHADQGTGNFLVSVIDKKSLLKGYCNRPNILLDSIGGGSVALLDASQCWFKADTFLVVFERSGSQVVCKKVYITASNALAQSAVECIITNNPDNCINPTIAADSSGNFLALWRHGPKSAPRLAYAFFDSTFALHDSATFPEGVDDVNKLNCYDDAPAVSYARKKFASVSWDPGGVLLRTFEVQPAQPLDTVSIEATRITSQTNAYFPAIAANGRFVVVLWIEAPATTTVYLKGVRCPITNGAIDIAAKDTLVNLLLANTVEAIDTIALSCAMDSSGNVGVCWHMNHFAQVGALVNRNILFDSGSWTSLPIRVQSGLRDSMCFDSSAITLGVLPDGSAYRGFLGVGVDSTAMADTISLTPTASLKTASKGLFSFFQYKLSLLSSPNLLKTPTLKKVFLRWNTKPRIDTLSEVRVNATRVPATFGDTITCMSRFDTVKCGFKVLDADSDFIYSTVTCRAQTVIDSFFGRADQSSMTIVLPNPVSDTMVACSFSARDKKNWAAQDRVLYIKTRNSPPMLRVRAVRNSSPVDTVEVSAFATINVQQSDSLEFIYSMRDTNDGSIKAYMSLNGARVDSTVQNVEKHFLFHCSSGRPQGDQFIFSATDPDTAVVRRVLCGVNHFPRIDSISIKGIAVHNGDTLRVTLGSPSPIIVHASDADVGYWDTLTYDYRRATRDTAIKDSSFVYVPARPDSSVTVLVTDLFGVRDSLRFFIKFPWYESDSVINPGLSDAKKTLRSGISLIVGGAIIDTVAIPIKNTGNDTLSVTSLRFHGSASRWLRMLVPAAGGPLPLDSSMLTNAPAIRCAADSIAGIKALFSADSLKGDGLVFDTVIIGTDDGLHAYDTLPVRFEYNDLPRIASVSIDFTKGKPYWLSKSKTAKSHSRTYTFPPNAKISITFTEAMDSSSARAAIIAYSVFDSLATSGMVPIPLTQTWGPGKTKVSLSPVYAQSSPYFHVKPPAGLFIPTDSIRMIVSSAITDVAKTPSGPNGLDVHHIARRSALADTVFSYRVDSISFTLTAVSPDSASTAISPAAPIILVFSSPPLPGTVDTAQTNNRSLIITSSYNGLTPLSFARIAQNSDSITFVPSKRFFYGDTVFCRYRAVTGRDSLGYPAVIDNNGIPVSLFDTAASQGDKRWYFVIKDILHTAVSPAAGTVNVSQDSAIIIVFGDTLRPGAIDTSPSGNRTLTLSSRCSGGAAVGFREVRLLGDRAVFYPALRWYYGDSVFCSYRGLSTADTAAYAVGKAASGPLFTKDKYSWSFRVKNITCGSTIPESSAVSASIHPEIVLRFSGPVYRGTFDADTSNRNRSFRMTSTYCKDTLLSFKSIAFSPDSSQVRITPKASFFSNDSVWCAFSGFLKSITYGKADNAPDPSMPMTGAYAWPFFIQNAGFYTYPNPYKPGSDPRHCSANGPCGIWFKNLHTLKRGISEVCVTIFSMDAHPLYSSKAAGERIMFATGNPDLRPEWKWDTRNQRRQLVASGLYFYAIYDVKDNVIMKGKLMIVR